MIFYLLILIVSVNELSLMDLLTPVKESSMFGKVVVIRRGGEDGSIFPMTMQQCLIGR